MDMQKHSITDTQLINIISVSGFTCVKLVSFHKGFFSEQSMLFADSQLTWPNDAHFRKCLRYAVHVVSKFDLL